MTRMTKKKATGKKFTVEFTASELGLIFHALCRAIGNGDPSDPNSPGNIAGCTDRELRADRSMRNWFGDLHSLACRVDARLYQKTEQVDWSDVPHMLSTKEWNHLKRLNRSHGDSLKQEAEFVQRFVQRQQAMEEQEQNLEVEQRKHPGPYRLVL